eukprot:m51a1_g4481 hypothetical protein (371) ;mRNA; f:269253-270947
MCILDAYSPTQGTDFIELRAVTDCAGAVKAAVRTAAGGLVAAVRSMQAAVPHEEGGKFFWRLRLGRLDAGCALHIEVAQDDSEDRLCVETATLAAPSGVRLMRFAILSDLHINHTTEMTKRLREFANDLAADCLARAEAMGAELIVLPGDVVDTESAADLETAREVLSRATVPIAACIGNHDEPESFHAAFGIPECGYYSFDRAGMHFVMLSCPNEFSVEPGSEQYRWLEADLEAHAHLDTFVFSHYSFVAHPFYKGNTVIVDNGQQYLVHGNDLCELLKRFPRVRACFAGHNNVPTYMQRDGVAHLLCAQPIQGPCGFDVVDVYEGGFVRMVQEIDQQNLLVVAKKRAGGVRWSERVRPDCERNVSISY